MGSYPEPKYYGADYMSGDERAQFLEWYEEQNDNTFCNKQELLAYCMDDVNVLRQAFVPLGICQAITISSICNKVFRIMFLKPDTVGIIPRARYQMGDRQPVEALKWLSYIDRTSNNITHAGNGREVHLPGLANVKVEGTVQRLEKSLSTRGVFGTGVNVYPIDICPSATLTKHC